MFTSEAMEGTKVPPIRGIHSGIEKSGNTGTAPRAINAVPAVMTGAMENINLFAFCGIKSSFVKSLMPSAAICNSPNGPTCEGPGLLCIHARTFLSI